MQPAVSYEGIVFNWGNGGYVCEETLLGLAGILRDVGGPVSLSVSLLFFLSPSF